MSLINWMEHHMLTCPFKAFTSFDCPGCGIQRAFVALLKGDFKESFHLYPALLLVLFVLMIVVIHVIFKLRHGAAIIKYGYILTMSIILVTYAFKMMQ